MDQAGAAAVVGLNEEPLSPSGRPRTRTSSVTMDSAGHVAEVPMLPLSAIRRTSSVSMTGPLSLSSRHRSSGIVVGTPLGFDVCLAVPRAQLRELQCAVCGALIESPVHAPCGHSFCHVHLATDGEEAQRLDRTASNLRHLCVDLDFPVDRAFEALAASPENLERAEELCREASGIEGHAVRVRPDVTEPQFSWGNVTRQSVGVLDRADNDHATVHFPTQSRWNCLLAEIEVEDVADSVRKLGSVVRVRRGIHPSRGWGALHGDKVGKVVHWSHSQVVVQCATSIWRGYVGELELVEPASGSRDDAVRVALQRLGESPSDICRATLGAILSPAANRVIGANGFTLRGPRRKAVMYSHGAMDLLRTAGYQMVKWDNRTTDLSRVVLESLSADFSERAHDALAALEEKYGVCPEPPAEDDERFVVLLSVALSTVESVPFETLWQDTLRQVVITALSPPGSSWAWTQRGWQSESELRQHLEKHIRNGPVAVAKWQVRREAELITERLTSMGLIASVESIGVVRGEELASEDADEISEVEQWEGSISEGARVRFCPPHGTFPQHVTAASVGIVGSQYRSSQTGLQLIVNFPGSVTATVNVSDVKVDEEAQLIRPGVRVKVRAGGELQYDWQGVQASDVGVVIKVTFDAICLVYVPGIPGLFRAALKDLDTRDLPLVARGDCPVCHKPFQGEHLAIDIAVEAQLKRIRRLMAGERTASNGILGGGDEARKTFCRTNTHRDELMCSICFELLNVPVTLSCGHSFCKAHIEAWLLHNHYCPLCKQRVLPQRLRRQHLQAPRVSFFDIELRDEQDEEPASLGTAQDWPEMCVNEMLQSQIQRYFPAEAKSRTTEIAAEVWECIQKRARGYLERLRAFLRQCGSHAITQFVALGLIDVDMPLPGTNKGTLLMIAAEQGLPDVVSALLERNADPLFTTSALHDAGSTALSVAAAQGRTEVLLPLLQAAEWPATRVADALAAAIEQGHHDCIEMLLTSRERAAELLNSYGFPALLMAVQANQPEVVQRLLDCSAPLDAPLTSGLLVHGAGAIIINGAYQVVGDFEGRPYYQNANGAIIYCKGWWKMTNTKAGLGKGWYYSMPEPHCETPEPPLGNWTTAGYDNAIQNVLPAPTVERLGCGDSGIALSPLLLSVHQGLMKVTTLLLDAKADPCMRAPHTGESVLQVASSGGDLSMVRTLLAARASTCGTDFQGKTPLSTACVGGHHMVVEKLLEASASPESDELPTPLLLAGSCGTFPPRPGGRPLAAARADKFAKVVMLLLKSRADVQRRTSEGSTPLHVAAIAGADAVAIQALLDAGVDATAVDGDGNTAIVAGILAGRSSCVDTLCRRGPLTAGCRADALTPLMIAALVGDVDVLSTLLLAATPESVNDLWALHEGLSGQVAVVRTFPSTTDGTEDVTQVAWRLVRAPLEPVDITVRCWRGHICERMNCLSGRTPACDVCARSIDRCEPLFLTCRRCNYDVCGTCSGIPPLARLPPDIFTDLRGWTPLHFVAAAGHASASRRLLESMLFSIKLPDAAGRTPLHWSAAGGHAWVVEALLDAGADASTVDTSGLPAVSCMPTELLRYALEEGVLQGSSIEVGRAAIGLPGEVGVAGVYRRNNDRDGRPCYSRAESPGWAICWDDKTSRWGLYQERYDAACIQYQNKADTQRCPMHGWETALASSPVPTFEEILPWRAGCSLLRATPDNLRPPGLVAALNALDLGDPPGAERVVQIPAGMAGSFAQFAAMPGATSTSAVVQLPPGAPPIEHLMQEMVRRGQLPLQDEPPCVQQ